MSRIFFTQVNIAIDADGLRVPGGKARFYENETATLTNVFSSLDPPTILAQPVEADENGVFPPIYREDATPIRVLLTDAEDVPLPGYPIDGIVPLASELSGASLIPFDPTETIPETNVQDAIEAVGELAQGELDIITRSFTAWTTAGSSNAFTITPSPALVTAYAVGDAFWIVPDRANTGAATLNVNGIGAANLMKLTDASLTPVALGSGDIQTAVPIKVWHDGTQFVALTSPSDVRIRGGAIRATSFNGPIGTQTPDVGSFTVVDAAQAGTAALPAYAFAGDLNTGMYRTGADGLGLTTGGAARLTIDSAGLVDIQNGLLRVPDGTAAIPVIARRDDTNTGVYFPSNGTVGITSDATHVARFLDAASGTLVVGSVTADPPTNVGCKLEGTGKASISRSAGVALHLNRSDTGSIAQFDRAGTEVGSIAVSAGATAYNTSSDGRLKENLRDFEAGEIIDQIAVYHFDWIAGGEGYGPVAQELHKVFPYAVTPGDPWGYDAGKLVPLLLREIQSLRARVAALEA